MIKQHHSHAVLALALCCLSANMLLNFAQQKLLQQKRSNNLITMEKAHSSPKLVWLMSFPNSGTSYTLREFERLSNYSMASNYGSQTIRKELVYPDLPHGPRFRGMSDEQWPRPMPKEYVMVKTHCTGYATNEGAVALKQDREEFIRGCATTRPDVEDAQKGEYDASLVHKAIHIVRDPFHNLISRFNCEHKLVAERGGDRALQFVERYPKNASGFHNFCRDLDSDFDKQYSKDLIPKSKRQDVKHTLCHDDIISYVQWHNHAFEACRHLHLPTLVIHYEDYEDDFNMTFSNLLDFMHLRPIGKAGQYSARKDYQDYFTKEDRIKVKKLVKQFASTHTWKVLARYFAE